MKPNKPRRGMPGYIPDENVLRSESRRMEWQQDRSQIENPLELPPDKKRLQRIKAGRSMYGKKRGL